ARFDGRPDRSGGERRLPPGGSYRAGAGGDSASTRRLAARGRHFGNVGRLAGRVQGLAAIDADGGGPRTAYVFVSVVRARVRKVAEGAGTGHDVELGDARSARRPRGRLRSGIDSRPLVD